MRRIAWLLLLTVIPAPLAGQTAAQLIAQGDSANPFLHPDRSLALYQRALAIDSNNYGAVWRVGRGYVDIAKQIENDDSRRDSLYTLARTMGERALQLNVDDPQGHFVVALALGRLALSKGGRDRVKFGRVIYYEASEALRLEPNHGAAHHIIGAWHAEVKRLSGTTRFFAKLLFSAKYLDRSSWDSATVHLEKAVALEPWYLYHRLVLAEVYLDINRRADAVAQLEAMEKLPDGDVLDPRYRRRAAELLKKYRK